MRGYFYLAVIFILTLFIVQNTYAQCHRPNTIIRSGEKLEYDAVYNWGIIWIEAGEVSFEVKLEKLGNKNVYHLITSGISLKKYDWIYKVRDYFDTWVSTTDLRPYKFVRNTQEEDYKVNNTLEFDYGQQKIYSVAKNSVNTTPRIDTFPLTTCRYDLLSAIYNARNLDFSNYKLNEKINMYFVIDGEFFTLYGRYLGKENIKIENGDTYRCHKFSVKMVEGTIFEGEEDLTVWVTDDENKIPVLVEAKILVGSVKAVLKNASGLRNPITSKIEN